MAPKRGPYRSYKQILSKREKDSITKKFIELQQANNQGNIKKRSGEITKFIRSIGISLSTVQGWAKSGYGQVPRGKHRKPGGGAKPLLTLSFEERLISWLNDLRGLGAPVTAELFLEHSREEAKSEGIEGIKFSRGWLAGMKKRWNITLRTPSEIKPDTTLNLSVINHIISAFWWNCNRVRSNLKIPNSRIVNVDEVPVWFDVLPTKVLDKVGIDRAYVKSNGRTKLRYTVCLAIVADGTKLPPFVIVHGKERYLRF